MLQHIGLDYFLYFSQIDDRIAFVSVCVGKSLLIFPLVFQ